jgi:hypothetical protein
MLRKILHPVLALTLAAGVGITTAEQAQAGRGAGVAAGIAAGIIGLGIIGATAGPRRGYYYDAYDGPAGCYRGPRTCNWENRYCFENRYGDYVCRGGDYVCRRPLICD